MNNFTPNPNETNREINNFCIYFQNSENRISNLKLVANTLLVMYNENVLNSLPDIYMTI